MDPEKVIVALAFLAAAVFSIRTIAQAWVASQRKGSVSERVDDDRLARLERAVDAIALEVERISEGQRFTTKLLSEQARQARQAVPQRLSSNTPI
jgi:hypothetical protein